MGKEKERKGAPSGAKGAANLAEKEARAAAAKAKTAPGSAGPRISVRLFLGRLRDAAGRAKALAKKLASKMLADGLLCFTVVFVVCAGAMLIWELVPWIFREGVTDIDPLPIIVFSLAFAFAAASLRYNIMKKFSGIRP